MIKSVMKAILAHFKTNFFTPPNDVLSIFTSSLLYFLSRIKDMKHYFKDTILDLVGKWVHTNEGALPPLSSILNSDPLCKSESALA